VFHLDNILGDFYNQVGQVSNRGKIDYTVPKLRYPDPKPYSYQVTQPSLSYREVEHIAPPKYESPQLRDLALIDEFPEGYTNIYDNYYIDNYFGSDGSDHDHFSYDNIEKIDLDHGHWNPDPHAKSRPIQPAWDHYFVTQVNNPAPEANYSPAPLKYQKNPGTYRHPDLGVDVYLVDDTIVPGQVYTPEEKRPKAIKTLKSIVEAEDYDGPNFDLNYKLQGYERPKAYPEYKPPTPAPYESPFPAVVGPWYGERTFEEVGAFNRDVPTSAYDVVVEEPVSTPEPVHIPEPVLYVPEPSVTVVEPEVVYVPEPEPEVVYVPEPEPVEEEESSYMRSDFKIPTNYHSKSNGYLSSYGKPSRSSRDEHHDDSDSESDHSDSESDHSDSDSDSDDDDENYLGDYNIGGFQKFGRKPTYSRRTRTSSRRSSDDSDDEGYTRSYRSRRSSRPSSSRSTRSYTKPASRDVPAALSSVSGASWLDALF
jgi:hypothetical protein